MTFSLTILGSSSGVPTAGRNTTAHVLNVRERFFLIDCGEGTQIQFRRFRIRFGKVNHIFITHLHSDHYIGLFGLLSTMSLIGRKTPLHLFGPALLERILENHFSLVADRPGFPILYHPLDPAGPALIHDDERVEVTSFPTRHRIQAWGYLFREKKRRGNGSDHPPRSFAHCADGVFNPAMAEVVRGVDLLYHEATYLHDKLDRALSTGHSTALQAGELARLAGVRQLLIGHFSARYKDATPLLEQARTVFENTLAAFDGLTIEID
ncbi:MAG: ribonuclease Z [Bacteroidales bacterium]